MKAVTLLRGGNHEPQIPVPLKAHYVLNIDRSHWAIVQKSLGDCWVRFLVCLFPAL